jgi:hypothetical protein
VRFRKLNLHQRVVLVVGLGITLYWIGRGIIVGGETGWIAYAPLNNTYSSVPFLWHAWAQLLVWLVLTVVWVVASLFILRSDRHRERANEIDEGGQGHDHQTQDRKGQGSNNQDS